MEIRSPWHGACATGARQTPCHRVRGCCAAGPRQLRNVAVCAARQRLRYHLSYGGVHPNLFLLSRAPRDIRAISAVALRVCLAVPVAPEKQRRTARRAVWRAPISDERPLIGAAHGAALVMTGRPGHDMYPAGGPYTIGGVQVQRTPCGNAGTVAADANRCETVAGSLTAPPQVWQWISFIAPSFRSHAPNKKKGRHAAAPDVILRRSAQRLTG